MRDNGGLSCVKGNEEFHSKVDKPCNSALNAKFSLGVIHIRSRIYGQHEFILRAHANKLLLKGKNITTISEENYSFALYLQLGVYSRRFSHSVATCDETKNFFSGLSVVRCPTYEELQ